VDEARHPGSARAVRPRQAVNLQGRGGRKGSEEDVRIGCVIFHAPKDKVLTSTLSPLAMAFSMKVKTGATKAAKRQMEGKVRLHCETVQ